MVSFVLKLGSAARYFRVGKIKLLLDSKELGLLKNHNDCVEVSLEILTESGKKMPILWTYPNRLDGFISSEVIVA